MISIIIPTLNEAENLSELFQRIDKVIKNYEIIIVDSNSRDNTFTVAKQLSKKYPIKVFNTGKLDLSNSIVFGINKTKGEIIVVMDADLQHPPEMLPQLINAIKQADISVASRFVKNAKINLGFRRKVVSKVFILLSYIACPKISEIKDTSTGFFAFKKNIVENVRLNPIGFKILLEILAKGNYKKVVEIPFHFKERKKGKSKFNMKQIRLSFKHLWRIAKYNKEPQRIGKFCIVGASGVVVNEGLLWLLTEFVKSHYLTSSVIAIESSIIANFILNDIWTFRKERKGAYFWRLSKFNFARLNAASVNFLALWFFSWLGLHYLISNLIGITLATIITYFSSLWWVWK